MQRELIRIKSKILNRDIDLSAFGKYGAPVILFPSLSDNMKECESDGEIEKIASLIDGGRCKVYCVSSFINSVLKDPIIEPSEKTKFFQLYNQFICEELLQFVFKECDGPAPVFVAGANHGAFIASNIFFKRPDLFFGLIAVDGYFGMGDFLGDFYDDDRYYNSPEQFLPNLDDDYWLSFLRNKRHIHIMATTGKNSSPSKSSELCNILAQKGVPHSMDLWDCSCDFEPRSWAKMIASMLSKKL